MKNIWSCLPKAFAEVLKISFKEIIKHIGHDGSEIWWPDLNDPFSRRGFHPQELIDVCLQIYNRYVIPIQAIPLSVSSDDKPIRIPMDTSTRMGYYIRHYNGVITGRINDYRHAIPWWCENIDSVKTKEPDFRVESFFIII